MESIPATLLGSVPGLRLQNLLIPAVVGAGDRLQATGRGINLLGSRLQVVAQRSLPLSKDVRPYDCSADLSTVVGGTRRELIVWTDVERRLPLGEVRLCVLLNDDCLLVGVEGRTGAPDESTSLVLVDVTSLEILGESLHDFGAGGLWAVPNPDGVSVVVNAQGGSMSHEGVSLVVGTAGRELRLFAELPNSPAESFSPSGSQLLVGPPADGPSTARVLAWPDLQEVAELGDEDLGWTDDQLKVWGNSAFLSADRICISTHDHGVLITDSRLRPIGALDVGHGAKSPQILVLDEHTIAVQTYDGADESPAQIWSF